MRHLSHVTSAHLSCVLPHRPAHTLWNPAGVLKQDGERDTGTVFLHPCDTRLPRMMVRTTTLPPALREVSRGWWFLREAGDWFEPVIDVFHCGRCALGCRTASLPLLHQLPHRHIHSLAS
jgi:hypothetical protein